jgi:preprotein translocase SecE subunit
MMQRRGSAQLEGNGSAALPPSLAPAGRPLVPDLSIFGRVVEFFREIRSELRQVAWPTRTEVANSATVVFIVLVLLVCLIFVLNYLFSHGVLRLLST